VVSPVPFLQQGPTSGDDAHRLIFGHALSFLSESVTIATGSSPRRPARVVSGSEWRYGIILRRSDTSRTILASNKQLITQVP
jgi:hypothetical protein